MESMEDLEVRIESLRKLLDVEGSSSAASTTRTTAKSQAESTAPPEHRPAHAAGESMGEDQPARLELVEPVPAHTPAHAAPAKSADRDELAGLEGSKVIRLEA